MAAKKRVEPDGRADWETLYTRMPLAEKLAIEFGAEKNGMSVNSYVRFVLRTAGKSNLVLSLGALPVETAGGTGDEPDDSAAPLKRTRIARKTPRKNG